MDKDFELANKIKIPRIGYGTYKEEASEKTSQIITFAIKNGYSLIDTATRYGNEKYVGIGIKNSKIKRKDIFITTKLWNDMQGYENAIKSFKNSLKEIGVKYIDLFLIHWPVVKGEEEKWKEKNLDTWKAFEYLYEKKLVRAIGVSNFEIVHLENLLKGCKIKPMVNQIEMHPGLNNTDLLQYCKKHNIIVQAYSPLGSGKIQGNEVLSEIAISHNKSPSQIALRWCVQKGVIPLPKSTNEGRIKENINIFDFTLSFKEMKQIDGMKQERFFPDPLLGK